LKTFFLLISENNSLGQDEQDSLRTKSAEESLTWQDYKAMPFTQCVSDQHFWLFFITDCLQINFDEVVYLINIFLLKDNN